METNFTNKEMSESRDGEYTKKYLTDTLYARSFRNDSGKYFSVVSKYDDGTPREVDAEFAFQRLKVRFTFIKQHKDINQVQITKYKYNRNKEWVWDQTEGIDLTWISFEKILGLIKFLSELDLVSISDGRIKLAGDTAPQFDADTEKIFKTLVATDKGKQIVAGLYDSGYLTSGLDIPDLIKRGLSQTKIDEKLLAISAFETLIEKPNVKEVSEIQTFLKHNPWIFGPEYKGLDFRDAGFAGNPDGRLQRIDGLSDILEVKLPSEELLRADDKGRQFVSPKLAESLGQLTGYLEYYYSEYRLERDDISGEERQDDFYGKYYKPKGILLIGRRGKEMVNSHKQTISAEPKNMRRLMSYFHWIEVLTYDDLIERARNGLVNLTAK